MHETLFYAALMFATGVGIPVMAALNGRLGGHYGSIAFAASVLFAVGLCAALIFMLAVDRALPQPVDTPLPFYYFLGGLFVAFYVLSITFVAPRFGVGNAVSFVLLGQLVSMALIDRYGLLGAPVVSLSPARWLGLVLMSVGVFLAVRR